MTFKAQKSRITQATRLRNKRCCCMNKRKGIKVMLCSLIVACILIGAFPALAETTGDGAAIYEVGFSNEHNLTGLTAAFNETFYIEDWTVSSASVTLCFSATPLARPEVSDFTLSLNSQRFYSGRFPESTGQVFETTIEIPSFIFVEGMNTLSVEAYIRTNDNDPCEEHLSNASWMTVLKDSSVSVKYTPNIVLNNVADCYEQFTSIDSLINDKSALFIPDSPSDSELTAAAFILSGISNNAKTDYSRIQLLPYSGAASEFPYAICVAGLEALPQDIKAQLTDAQWEAASSDAVVAMVQPDTDSFILVVTGSNDAALINAARLFGNAEYMSQCVYSWRKVTSNEDVTFNWRENDTALVLTDSGSYIYGPFRQSVNYYIKNGSNHILTTGSKISLDFRYAENLDFDRSLVTVYINDKPIGSAKLTKERAGGDSLTLDIPDDMSVTGNFVVGISFDLEIKDLPCTIRRADMPWAYVSPLSTLELVSAESPFMLFDYYPSPFVSGGVMNDVVVVLPDDLSQADIEAMGKLLLTFGRYQNDNSGSLRVCRNSTIGNVTDSNIVSIGALYKNYIAQQLNSSLYFKFSDQGTTILSNEKRLIEPNYGALLGTGQLLVSPYSDSDDNALLLISGVTDENMLKAISYLGDVTKTWGVSGDGFVTDGDTIFFHRFKSDNSKELSLIDKILARNDIAAIVIVSVCILALFLVTTIFITAKRRRNARSDHE